MRTLFRLRGLPGGGSVLGALRAIGLAAARRGAGLLVLGAAGRPWSPRARLVPFDKAGPGQVRMVFDITATADGDGMSILATETRVAAMDASARRAFRRVLARGRPVLGAHPPALARSRGARASLTAIGLACLSALLFGAMSVGLRMGLNRYPDVEVATIATVGGALAVALVAARRRRRRAACTPAPRGRSCSPACCSPASASCS